MDPIIRLILQPQQRECIESESDTGEWRGGGRTAEDQKKEQTVEKDDLLAV